MRHKRECFNNEKAEIAQLVEHNLAKVGVASSSLVFRSKEYPKIIRVFFAQNTKESKYREQGLLWWWNW